jgi:hypothetical protein
MNRLVVFVLVVTPLLAGADLQLEPIHPQESVAETLNKRFSLENALANIESIEGWLDSFRRLTLAAKGKITAASWKEIGNTEWDIQTLGFANQPRAIEGALRYQDYLLKKALWQLAVLEAETKKAPLAKAEQARLELAQVEAEFQTFWDSMSIAD